MPVVIHALGGGHTRTHAHTQMPFGKVISINQVHAWFKNSYIPFDNLVAKFLAPLYLAPVLCAALH